MPGPSSTVTIAKEAFIALPLATQFLVHQQPSICSPTRRLISLTASPVLLARFVPWGQNYPTSCLTGHYCNGSSGQPIPCPPGTFNNVTGAVDQSSCIDCTVGSFGPGGTARSSPVPCWWVLCVVCCVLCVVCCVLCAVCCVLCAVCCVLWAVCCVLCVGIGWLMI